MRAITKNTRRVTALTLAAALVVAVYLNWQYARTGVTLEEDAVNVSAVSQETVPVTDELMTEAEAVSSATAAPSSLRKRGSSGPKPTMKPWTAFRKR